MRLALADRRPGADDAPPGAPRGVTLLELVVVLVLLGVVTAIALPARRAALDRAALSSASRELVLLLGHAREVAVARGSAAVRLDSVRGTVRLTAPGAPAVEAELASLYGVQLGSTRDSLAFDARGLGHGAANLRIVLRRGHAADTIVVSRLGRVRR